MKVAVVESVGKIALKEADIPKVSLDSILIRVESCAICGSDLRIMYGKDSRTKFPMIIGHEMAGIVEQVGDKVEDFKPISENEYEIIAAGPTTSARMSLYEENIIKKYGIKAIIGKGGMDKKTSEALQKNKAVYLSALGGAAVLLAESIVKVKDVIKLEEFGIPEALWVLEVKDFPAIVTMDAHNNSLHEIVLKKSEENLKRIIA